VSVDTGGDVSWKDRASLEDHFRRHGREVGARDAEDYLRIAREVMRVGQRFTYRLGVRARVGYYHARSKRFVAVDAATGRILSLSRRSENYPRNLADSDYSRKGQK
jgi:hypothetical protein